MNNSVETYLVFLFFFFLFGGPIGLLGWSYKILDNTMSLAVAAAFPIGGALVMLVASFLFPTAGSWPQESEGPSKDT